MKLRINKITKVDLISLIDMVFILVIFFMINNMSVQSENLERRFAIPTPKNERGSNAQVLIQIIDENHFFWLDHTDYPGISEQLNYWDKNKRYPNLFAYLRNNNIFSWDNLEMKLDELFTLMSGKECFIVVRCPNEIPYFRVIEVINLINTSKLKTAEYGCVGGELDDILSSNAITVGYVEEEGAIRNIIKVRY